MTQSYYTMSKKAFQYNYSCKFERRINHNTLNVLSDKLVVNTIYFNERLIDDIFNYQFTKKCKLNYVIKENHYDQNRSWRTDR